MDIQSILGLARVASLIGGVSLYFRERGLRQLLESELAELRTEIKDCKPALEDALWELEIFRGMIEKSLGKSYARKYRESASKRRTR